MEIIRQLRPHAIIFTSYYWVIQKTINICISDLAVRLRIESCLQVKLSRYSWQPATIWRRDSGLRQKGQSGLCDNVADGPEKYMFLGRWDCASDQIGLTDDNEYLKTSETKKPWDVRWCCSLSSWLEQKSQSDSLATSRDHFVTLLMNFAELFGTE